MVNRAGRPELMKQEQATYMIVQDQYSVLVTSVSMSHDFCILILMRGILEQCCKGNTMHGALAMHWFCGASQTFQSLRFMRVPELLYT